MFIVGASISSYLVLFIEMSPSLLIMTFEKPPSVLFHDCNVIEPSSWKVMKFYPTFIV